MKLNPIKREFRLLRTFKSLKVALFVYPFLLTVILFIVFHNENMHKLPVAIVDQDHSLTSTQIIHKLSALPEIEISQDHAYSDLRLAKEALLAANVYAVIYIPPRFEQLVLANKSPEITTFYNNQFMTIGSAMNRSIYAALTALLQEQKIDQLMKNGVPLTLAKNQVQSLSVALHPVFNPTLSFVDTLANGAFSAMMQILIMMIFTASFYQEWKNREAFKTRLKASNYSILALSYQKMPLYILVFSVAFLFFDLILHFYFNLQFAADYLILFCATLLFIIANLSIAACFSLFITDKLRNYGLVGIFCSPAFGFTGLIFPHLAMNQFADIWSAILPVNWIIKIRINQLLRNDDLNAILTSFIALILMIVVALLLAQLKINQLKKQALKGEPT